MKNLNKDVKSDYFVNQSYRKVSNVKKLIADLRDYLKTYIAESGIEISNDLAGVINYLDDTNIHSSEGRNSSFYKKSFSITEIEKASGLPKYLKVKYLLYRYKYNHYPRNGLLTDYPILLAIEPTSICNLRCTMCFQADSTFTRDKTKMGLMDFEMYKYIIDDGINNDLCAIVLASRGEPTLHKRFPEMIKYAKQKDILDIKINTNATKLTKSLSRKILHAFDGGHGVQTIVFSVDSSNKKEFEKIRVGANFDNVVENIDNFNIIRKKEFPDSIVRTRISMVIIGDKQDVEDARIFWSTKVDEFAVSHAIDRLNIYDLELSNLNRPCTQLFERLYIWFDGATNPCDSDYKSKLTPGSIKDHSIKSIWNGTIMTEYRKKHLRGDKNSLNPCDKCVGA
jgi:organic radical activating enzyme